MIRLLQIEWIKLKNYRPFWVLIGMYGLGMVVVCGGGRLFLQYLKSQGADFNGIDPTIIPLYDFPDIWQNLAFLATMFKVIPGFIVVITVANEARFRTLRQNVIDGLSKGEFLFSKLLFILALSIASTLLLFVLGLLLGQFFSHPDGLPYRFRSLDFLFAHFLAVLTYLNFALLLTLILPKAGLIIVGLFMYTYIFEPILSVILWNYPHFSNWVREVPGYLPVTSQNNLIHFPFSRYVFYEIQDFVSVKETVIVTSWLLFNMSMSYGVLRWKDW